MVEIQLLHFPLFIYPVVIISLFWLWYIITKWLSGGNKNNIPPSPRKLPIIGNLHHLGTLPHRNLQILAQKHGPLMLLHLGTVPLLIASSAEAARVIMRTHDINFANRPPIKAFKKLIYDGKSISLSPYSEYWRQAKSVFVLQLLSSKRVQSFRSIREEETAHFVDKISRESSSSSDKTQYVINLTKMFSEFTNDVICRSAFGRKYSASENGEKALMLLTEFLELLGTVNIGDFVPWLGWITRFNGLDKRLNRVAKDMDHFLEDVIQEHMENDKKTGGDNFVDILLEIYNDNTNNFSSFDRDSIKALLLDVFAGGTDSVSTILEWLMAELLRHPNVMEKLQKEVREIIGSKQDITDDDLEKMDYMKAVIKETFRCHPPSPFLAPRIAVADVKLEQGYDVSKGTWVLVNAWAIGRDPNSWNQPEKFEPERFLKSNSNNNNNNNIDFKGLDFELIPFGAGRRGCPGISFAVTTIELVLANLVLKFNWGLPDGKDLDMSERQGGIVHRAIPLLAVATHK